MKQLDLFQKNVVLRPRKPVFKDKYKHRYTDSMSAKPYWRTHLPFLIMTCTCKKDVKVYYDHVKPEPKDIPFWDKWGKLSYNEFEESYDTTYCPYCGYKIYMRNAKIKLIEVN